MFTIGIALFTAKYFEEHFGGKAYAAGVGAAGGFVLDYAIFNLVLERILQFL